MMCADVTESERLKELGLKELAIRWLFSQGVSTVLLFAILIGMYYRYPQLIEQQETERKGTREDFKMALKEQRADFREALTELADAIKESERTK